MESRYAIRTESASRAKSDLSKLGLGAQNGIAVGNANRVGLTHQLDLGAQDGIPVRHTNRVGFPSKVRSEQARLGSAEWNRGRQREPSRLDAPARPRSAGWNPGTPYEPSRLPEQSQI